ncbi:MAG TPA: YhcN/YlaJ family sporulation lipoprotein [Bacillota bacterium]|nr:YhcN/YlaJ family sporulation lipoprotein [Bacillota bacterium]
MLTRVVLCIGSFFLIVGCQQDNREQALDEQKADHRLIQVENTDQENEQSVTNEEISDHLASIAKSVPDVNDAISIVAGPYAVVGIDVDKDLDRSRVGTIKYSVIEALQNDPYGKTAVVIADGDVNERIRRMQDKINQGYPIQGVVDELAAIVGRYMPTFPVPKDRPVEPDQNKQTIPQKEQQDLDDIQDDQSNHHKDRPK